MNDSKDDVSKAKRQNTTIFELILDDFPDIIHSVDDDGNIILTNHAAEELLGYSRWELMTMNIRQIYAPEVIKDVENGFSDLKAKGNKRVESILITKTGEKIPVEVRSFAIYGDNGEFLRSISVLRDIRKIKELEAGLIHAGRLAAIGELASGVAHDINNPLTVVLMATEILRDNLKDIEEQSSAVESIDVNSNNINKAAESIRKLVNHLRNFSRSSAEEHEKVDMANVIADALFITSSKAKTYQVNVTNNVTNNSHFVLGSPNRLEQVFVNLITNACDALEPNKEANIEINIKTDIFNDTECWECTVHDNGSGIPEKQQSEIFNSFFTTKPKDKGTGLGLSISRGIVHDHKGNISVYSSPETGTTFSVMLPVHS